MSTLTKSPERKQGAFSPFTSLPNHIVEAVLTVLVTASEIDAELDREASSNDRDRDGHGFYAAIHDPDFGAIECCGWKFSARFGGGWLRLGQLEINQADRFLRWALGRAVETVYAREGVALKLDPRDWDCWEIHSWARRDAMHMLETALSEWLRDWAELGPSVHAFDGRLVARRQS